MLLPSKTKGDFEKGELKPAVGLSPCTMQV